METGYVGITVLVVEDEVGVRDLVRRYLERDGFRVMATGSGAEAMAWLEDAPADLAVVDLGLPDVPGEEVLRVASRLMVPVVVLSSRGDVDERIHGLELGAADYVPKPFSPRELVLRVRSVLGRGAASPISDEQSDEISYDEGQLVVRPLRRELLLGRQPVALTPTEWALLLALLSRPGRVYSRSELADRVHDFAEAGSDRTIDSHIKNLRHKLGEDPLHAHVVQTVQGFGYRTGARRDS
jgi:DNA-binding response OmpR family regulator